MQYYLILGILFLYPIITLQRSDFSSLSYIAAVVEYKPTTNTSDDKTVTELNTINYLKFLKKASEYMVDIIIFPETTLTFRKRKESSYIPDPTDKITPCSDHTGKYANYLKKLSCAAKNYGMYVVVNNLEKFDCTGSDCPSDGYLIYNTNVVFDRFGEVIAKYRKYNLFGEPGVDRPSEPIPSTFTTDFGVTFGQFICFDLLFESPAYNLVRDLNVTDIAFSSHWYSELPHLFSVQVQAAWAYANNVNFLASGFNFPATGSGGTGIYAGRNGYVQIISKDKSNVLLVAEVPKMINGKHVININQENTKVYNFNHSEIATEDTVDTKIFSHKIEDLNDYTTNLIDLKKKEHHEITCNQNLCCEIKLKIDFHNNVVKNNSNYYRYRFAVFNGTRSFDGFATGSLKVCGILFCTNDTLSSCGKLFDSHTITVMPTIFQSIVISMEAVRNKNLLLMPTSLTADLKVLNTTDYSYGSTNLEELVISNISLNVPRNDILTFGLYGRDFALDNSDVATLSNK